MKLTHISNKGEAKMVDISNKKITYRTATAQSFIKMSAKTLDLIESGSNKKGDVLATARIAGIQAAKNTARLIPMCHPLLLTSIAIDLHLNREKRGIEITSTCKLSGQTGAEMEALTAASITALTLYDMCKAVDKNMVIINTKLLQKTGGRSDNTKS